MNIEKLLEEKIKSLQKVIEHRDKDKEWLKTRRTDDSDTNGYYWFHCGEGTAYAGRKDALVELLKEIRKAE